MSPSRAFLLCAALATAAAVPACGFALDSLGTAGSGGDTSGGSGSGEQDASIDIGPDGVAPADPYHPYTSLCGTGCKPGEQDAGPCEQGSGGAGGGGAGGSGGAGGGGGAAGGAGGGGGAAGGAPLGCQLVYQDNATVAQCGTVGTFGADGPCQSVSDCIDGFGCALTQTQTGACRQYCCGHIEDCAADTYCRPQPMLEAAAAGAPDVMIPVCVPATNCKLLADDCDPGLTCTIVRADGTTSCVDPGPGGAGEPCWCNSGDCGCAAGFTCSLTSLECKKLCHLGQASMDCGPGATCQGGSMGFPPEFGVCVGGDF